MKIGDSRPAKHPLPAIALDGQKVGIASQEKLQMLDATTGTVLWESGWPQEAAAHIAKDRESLSNWQSLRWSSHGVLFFDGKSRTMTVEWRALMARGDFIVPVGTRSLMCLKCGP